MIAAGAQNAKIGYNTATRANQSDGFFGGKLSRLIEIFVNVKLITGAEECFYSFLS